MLYVYWNLKLLDYVFTFFWNATSKNRKKSRFWIKKNVKMYSRTMDRNASTYPFPSHSLPFFVPFPTMPNSAGNAVRSQTVWVKSSILIHFEVSMYEFIE